MWYHRGGLRRGDAEGRRHEPISDRAQSDPMAIKKSPIAG